MKKKILTLCLVICLAATAIIGGTLAYFTDTDEETNVFTIGALDITLNDDFQQNSQLIPGKDIEKNVTITVEANSVDSYVWYTWAIPAALDNADASKNIVHVNHAGGNWDDYYTNTNYEGEHNASRLWDVSDTPVEKTTIDGIEYNVYVVYYKSMIPASTKDYTTSLGMTKVYMDKNVDIDDDGNYYINGAKIDYKFSNGVKIPVKAYGIQAEGFNDVYEAYSAYQTAAK